MLQVQKWFQNKHEELQAKSTSPPAAFKLSVDLSGFSVVEKPESSQKPEGHFFFSMVETVNHECIFSLYITKVNFS